MMDTSYKAPALMGNAHVQSILAGLKLRRPLVESRARSFVESTRQVIVDCGEDVRLLGHYTPPAEGPLERLVVLLHGWEGSADSMYILSSGSALWSEGYGVFRLNFRDHGPTEHLNEGIFHSCRLSEVLGAMRWINDQFPGVPVNLAGFSLGGNFALRVAADAGHANLNLRSAVAICPVIDPAQTMDALENGYRFYNWYFIQKWRKSLERKQAFFPEQYDFGRLTRFDSLAEMTRHFVVEHTEYPDLDTYLQGYSLLGNRLKGLEVPATILSAADDPIIPADTLAQLTVPKSLRVEVSQGGGHCGFIHNWKLNSYVDHYLSKQFASV